MPMAMAVSASPTCRIAARCFACPRASMAWQPRDPAALTIDRLRRGARRGRQAIEILFFGSGTISLPSRPRCAAALQGGRHRRRADVDRGGGAHLQCPARRGPRRRGRADRRRLTVPPDAADGRAWTRCARPTVTAISPPFMRRKRARGARSRSMPSMPRSPPYATVSASRCPAKSGCNGGATCSQRRSAGAGHPVAEALLDDDRSA